MGGAGSRIISKDDVVTFPTSKAAGAVVLQSSELYDLEGGSWDKATIHMQWTGDSKMGDTITVKPYVSWNGGDSFVQVGSYTEFAKELEAGDTIHVLPFARRVRIDVDFDAAATLSADHGNEIDVMFYEKDPEARRHTGFNVLTLTGDTLTASATENGDTVDLGASSVVDLYWRVGDTSKIADTLTFTLQHSEDASTWRTYDTIATTGELDGATNLIFSKKQFGAGDTTGLFRYVRASITADAAGSIGASSGLMVHIVGIEK